CTGFASLDAMTGGLQRTDLVLLAALPGRGKTALALNAAMHAASRGHHVAFFSLEMSIEQLSHRLVSAESRVDGWRLRHSQMSGAETGAVLVALDRFKQGQIIFDDSHPPSVYTLRSRRRMILAARWLDL